jgi:hypothetical protein
MIIINQQNADVIMVTQTWLTDAIPDEALHIPDFTIVRKDRPTRRGGGRGRIYKRIASFQNSSRLSQLGL